MSLDDRDGGSPEHGAVIPAKRELSAEFLNQRFKPGQSGNPSGRPKVAKEFRKRCREGAQRALELMLARIAADDMPNEQLVSAFKALSDFGGLIPASQLSTVQSGFIRSVMAVAGADSLSAEQKREQIASLSAEHEQTVVGDEDE